MMPLMVMEAVDFLLVAGAVAAGAVVAEAVIKTLFATDSDVMDPPPFTSIGNSTMGAGILHVEISASSPTRYSYVERWGKSFSRITLVQKLADGSVKDSWSLALDEAEHLTRLEKRGMITVEMEGFTFTPGVATLMVVFDLVYLRKISYGTVSASREFHLVWKDDESAVVDLIPLE